MSRYALSTISSTSLPSVMPLSRRLRSLMDVSWEMRMVTLTLLSSVGLRPAPGLRPPLRMVSLLIVILLVYLWHVLTRP